MIDSHQHYWQAGRSFRWQELSWVVGAVSYAWKAVRHGRIGP